MSRVNRRKTSSRSFDCSEHSSNKSIISSLSTEDFQNPNTGTDPRWNTSRRAEHAAFDSLSQASHSNHDNEVGGSDQALRGSNVVHSGKCGSSVGSSKGSNSNHGNTLFDSDQALYGGGVYSERSDYFCGSSRGSYNNGGNTLFDSDQALHGSRVCSENSYTSNSLRDTALFDSDQAMCGRRFTRNSGSSKTSSRVGVLNSYHGDSNSSDSSSVGLSQFRMSDQFATSNSSKRWERRRTDEMSQISNVSSVQRAIFSPIYESTEDTTVRGVERRALPYQIEYRAENLGRQISTSKRIIHFRFGFANSSVLSQGTTGHNCRGVEHHLCITWSITGNKRLISMDGREIMYSAGKREDGSRRADIFEASWVTSEHSYELVCYSYKPAIRPFSKRDSR